MEHEKSAGIIIFYMDKEPYFLLLEYPTYWGFVRGNIEECEKEKETAIREAKEEANIDNINIMPEFKYIQSWFYRLKGNLRKKSAIYFLGEISKKESKKTKISLEHKSFKYCNLQEALNLMRIKNEKTMLKKAYEFIKENKKQKSLSSFK